LLPTNPLTGRGFIGRFAAFLKIRVNVTPRKTAPGPEGAAIFAALEHFRIDRSPGDGGVRSLEWEISDAQTPERRGQLDEICGELDELFAKWDLCGATVHFERDGSSAGTAPTSGRAPAPDHPATETQKWTPEGAKLRDLDGSGAHAALPKVLAETTSARKKNSPDREQPPDEIATQRIAVVKQTADATLVRVRAEEGEKFVAIANPVPGRFCSLNFNRGALIAALEAARSLVCAGANPMAMSLGFALSSRATIENFLELRETVRGLTDAAKFFRVPVARIDFSFRNKSAEHASDPIVTVAMAGAIQTEQHALIQSARVGDKLMLLGGTPTEIGGSLFLAVVHRVKTGDAPATDLSSEKKLHDALIALIRAGIISSALQVAEGGLMATVCTILFANDPALGARLDLTSLGGSRADALLFGESQGRVIVAVAAGRVGTVLSEAHMRGVSAVLIGEVTDEATLGLKTRSLATEWPIAELWRI